MLQSQCSGNNRVTKYKLWTELYLFYHTINIAENDLLVLNDDWNSSGMLLALNIVFMECEKCSWKRGITVFKCYDWKNAGPNVKVIKISIIAFRVSKFPRILRR